MYKLGLIWCLVTSGVLYAQEQEATENKAPGVINDVHELEKQVTRELIKGVEAREEEVPEVAEPSKEEVKTPKKEKQILVKFDFENEDLVNIINKFAALRHINIILPYGTQAINQKVTFRLGKKIPLAEAERYLDTFLDIAGYTKVPHGDFFTIVKIDPNVTRETLPLFVGVPPKDLPSDGRIQVVYYFQNLKVPENNQGTDPLHVILNDMLSVNRNYLFDSKANAVIISDKASNIKATMAMLLELDTMGIRDAIRKIQLYHASATTLATLIQQQIIAVTGDQRGRLRADVKSEAGLFFAPGTKVVADAQNNALILIGKEPAVERLTDFINEYLDVPLESGRSILHYYDCQYLDAESFATVLKQLVTPQGRSGQATTDQQQGSFGRAFDGVIIAAETVVKEEVKKSELAAEKEGASILKGTVIRGGNRIVVAAKNSDWQRILKLIRELDKPQLQIIVQVMIVDFSADQSKIFGMQTRNPSTMQLPHGVNFQAANLVDPILVSNTAKQTPTTLATDLLMLIGGTATTPATSSAAEQITSTNEGVGSTILSINDPAGTGVWTFLQWLQAFGELKVLSHPYIVVLNNQKGEESITQTKRLPGQSRTGEGGAVVSEIDDVPASLKVSVVPRASSADRLNMQISIKIDQFIGDAGNLATREIHTSANLSSGQMLILGGLAITQTTDSEKETPLLGQVPILGWFFSSKKKASSKTNLAVFIIPTIIEPKMRSGLNKYTRDRIAHSYGDMNEGALFDQFKDPVNYLFFRDRENIAVESLDEYLAESKGNFVRPPTKRERRGPQTAEERKNIIPAEAYQLKVMLAGETNPVLSAKSKKHL